MSELEELLRQKAEIEARIRSIKAAEAEGWRLQLAKLVTQLREINELPAALVSVFTVSGVLTAPSGSVRD